MQILKKDIHLSSSTTVPEMYNQAPIITKHPVSACVPKNYCLTLHCQAKGLGILNYQWFQTEDEEVPGGTKSDLVITAEKTQVYVCRVNDQHNNCVFSEWVKVKVHDIGDVSVSWQGQPWISVHPVSTTVKQGHDLKIQCVAFGIPRPVLQWYKNGNLLQNQTNEMLIIKNAEKNHEGTYLCSVTNIHDEKWTEPAEVYILCTPPDKISTRKYYATDKVALLIGNLNYSYHPNLIAPVMDVHELAHLLQELNFRVVSLLDLTKQEMTAAILQYQQLLSKGVYALFYYAGHGYECSGRNYLVPIDAPQPYRRENCISVQRIMKIMQETHTSVNVVLLDTCRKWYNQEFNPSEIRPLEPLGNTVYGYATCEDAEAYEVQDGERSTGIFTKYLNKRILQEGKITHVLEQVLEDLGRDPLITGKQVMEIKHTLKEARSLTDSIHSVGYTMAFAQRNLCWKNANDVPPKKEVKFVCGVEVELGFSALFSNVLIVFATIKKAAADTLDCSISLQSIPVLEDVFSNHSSQSDSFDSFQLQGGENADSVLRLCGLQKLKTSMAIKVDLHYTDANSRHRLVETKEEDIGNPLVAKCELHRHINVDKLPENGAKGFSSASKSVGHMGPQQTPVPQAFRPSTRHAENIQKLLESHSSIKCNEPEENDESDILDQRRVKH
ncbi:mucosa-associated lymphoid tissue lymphoma translocation protein 1 homolog [Erpetoichthys calabaricus]|uniref:mucosa-associated lymphoid tissue lymphoma translocation protein 1 homolog n=1 Tax=Erpetoichthys calabaricus TaxID=27687 RepID=UPI002234C71B|nr:mucosa-associated lymphoid tissue lymphoma translocation protein 1 homolog [Erpetoichthys calabaricus]XP_028678704.2 mucosa-associated lymphoid tissue lymphoma translocation protein 1 homolog [Erpetoichthys calabaricus]